MRVAFLVYGVLYVVIEVVGYQLEQVSWPELTGLDVASALTNAFLTVAVLVAVLVGIDLAGHRWRRHLRAVALERARLALEEWAAPEPLTVQAWRPGPLALTAAPPRPTGSARPRAGAAPDAYAPNAYARQAWSEDAARDASGRLL
ncbi:MULTISPECIES: hypothetical protein [unclassified Modestobacter]|uniref:hypothetical protein n=1 Tax=unclassified Modestobacter TaxID=2643866 RepID=UPI0022AA17E0|nr:MULTISPECIES: hypothetical protein [unclassified Modestobacter]MCZ2827034.1 hypothetical protein [Modestobacter sp. VKM Ac-2981]MCZ2855270.1 hypothetical protein [Modestobacter sp. VKM Ac-2982]